MSDVAADIEDPEPHDVRGLSRLVDRAARTFAGAERDALEPFGLAPAAFRLLELLAREGPLAPSDVARRLGVRQPTVSGWIASLGAERVERTRDGEDGRRAQLALTQAGRELHGRGVAAIRRRQLRLLAALAPHAQADLVEALRVIAAAGATGDEPA